MTYRFGKSEELTCIVDVPLKGDHDLDLCLAYKTTSFSVFAPAYFHDDGYVLAVKGSIKQYYPLPKGEKLTVLQQSGALPSPLPAYHPTALQYAFGYLFWIGIAFGLASLWMGSAFKRRRAESLQTDLVPSTSAPELRTKTDAWLAAEARKLLTPGEVVQHQAYGTDRDLDGARLGAMAVKALYAILTNQRLILIHARVGAFGPLRENRGVTELARSSIVRVDRDERHLRFVFEGGVVVDFFAQWHERSLSNQRRFLRDVPRLVGTQRSFAGEAA